MRVIIDGNNVMGAAAGGWWRDRPAAVRRLLARVQCYARSAAEGDRIVLVLDVPQADLPEGLHDGVEVVYATRRGRDAADDRIRALVTELERDEATEREVEVEVVTSDRALRADMGARVRVTGAGTFLGRLEAAGC